jgi:Ni,Fe-hydrogenase III large subunit
MARFSVRAEEVAVSARLVADLAARLGGRRGSRPPSAAGEQAGARQAPGTTVAAGLSLVEAWRGTACHRVELDGAGRLSRVAAVDPSFFTWPALPVALADTIVPDFPLANKSFNQSYAGNDL